MDGGKSQAPPLWLWVLLLTATAYPAFQYVLADWVYRDGITLQYGGTWLGRDFTNLYLGGRYIAEGIDIYDLEAYRTRLELDGIIAEQNASYPPTVYLLGVPLSYLPYWLALSLWHGVGAFLFVLAAKPFVRFPWLWLFAFPAMLSIPNGQYGLYVAAFWMFAFRGSGIAAGLLTIKPHLGILLALAMLVRRRWTMIAVAVGVALAMLVAAELAFGLTRSFLVDGAGAQLDVLLMQEDRPFFGAMPSAFVMARGTGLAWFVHLAFALAALALIAPLSKLPLRNLCFPLATATFIILPYAFTYDMSVVRLGLASLLWSQWGQLGWVSRAILAGALLTTTFIILAPLFLLAALWVQQRHLLAQHRHSVVEGQ